MKDSTSPMLLRWILVPLVSMGFVFLNLRLQKDGYIGWPMKIPPIFNEPEDWGLSYKTHGTGPLPNETHGVSEVERDLFLLVSVAINGAVLTVSIWLAQSLSAYLTSSKLKAQSTDTKPK